MSCEQQRSARFRSDSGYCTHGRSPNSGYDQIGRPICLTGRFRRQPSPNKWPGEHGISNNKRCDQLFFTPLRASISMSVFRMLFCAGFNISQVYLLIPSTNLYSRRAGAHIPGPDAVPSWRRCGVEAIKLQPATPGRSLHEIGALRGPLRAAGRENHGGGGALCNPRPAGERTDGGERDSVGTGRLCYVYIRGLA